MRQPFIVGIKVALLVLALTALFYPFVSFYSEGKFDLENLLCGNQFINLIQEYANELFATEAHQFDKKQSGLLLIYVIILVMILIEFMYYNTQVILSSSSTSKNIIEFLSEITRVMRENAIDLILKTFGFLIILVVFLLSSCSGRQGWCAKWLEWCDSNTNLCTHNSSIFDSFSMFIKYSIYNISGGDFQIQDTLLIVILLIALCTAPRTMGFSVSFFTVVGGVIWLACASLGMMS